MPTRPSQSVVSRYPCTDSELQSSKQLDRPHSVDQYQSQTEDTSQELNGGRNSRVFRYILY